MSHPILRIVEVKINKFKNIEQGNILVSSYQDIKKGNFDIVSDIVGIYGQNGSGKTAFVETVSILKLMLQGERLPDYIFDFIAFEQKYLKLTFVFYIDMNDYKYMVYYSFILGKNSENQGEITEESISYSVYLNNKWKPKMKLIEYNKDYEIPMIKPLKLYDTFKSVNKNNILKLNIVKALAIENKSSFLFHEKIRDLISENNDSDNILNRVTESLRYFGKVNLLVVLNRHLGIINMNQLIPFCFRIENSDKVTQGDFSIKLFEPSIIKESQGELLKEIVDQINIVLGVIIPNLSLEIIHYGNEITTKTTGIKVELASQKEGVKIPLKYESEGIKKIISILSSLIAMYNNEGVCLVIDELDAGIFEYLLGEILKILKDRGKGQLFFTSHNLRPLEMLKKDSVIFTTNNPKNRYIHFSNMKKDYNLRDFYLRGIVLGGQKESIYKETNPFEIGRAFRLAGRNQYEE